MTLEILATAELGTDAVIDAFEDLASAIGVGVEVDAVVGFAAAAVGFYAEDLVRDCGNGDVEVVGAAGAGAAGVPACYVPGPVFGNVYLAGLDWG